MIGGRVAWLGLALAVSAGVVLIAFGRHWDAVVLTVTAAVGIINTLWLEGVLVRVLQPGQPRVSRSTAAIIAGRFALWVLLFAVLYLIRERVHVWAVAAGIGCFLLALAVAGAGGQPEDRGEG